MELFNLTAHELVGLFRKKEVSVVEATKSAFERLEKIEPKIQSFITLCKEEALEKAEKVQEKYDRGEAVSPLAGVPMALKDNICTKGIKTTCASKMLHNFVPPYDATVTARLEEADTVLTGKTNMDEFAMGSSTERSYFKKTKNPWDLERVPGGSSGGSAASVAARQVFFSLGSDTGGSIRQPASLCGVIGMKPTYGTVSRYGVIAFASSLDQIGPLTRDVTDLAIVMNVISGHDSMDGTSANIKHPDFTKSLVNDVKGLRIGVPKEYMGEGISEDARKAVLSVIDTLKRLGAEYEEISLPMAKYALPAYYIISSAETSSNMARYDGIKYGYRAEKYTDLLDLYNQTRSEGFGAEVKRRIIIGTYALSAGYYDAYYKKALQVRTLIKNDFDRAFEKYDVIITPATPTTAFKFGEKSEDPIEMYFEDMCTVSVNIAGLPALVMPCGFDGKGLPIGMQFIGKAFDESTLIRAAYTFEQNTDFHKRMPEI